MIKAGINKTNKSSNSTNSQIHKLRFTDHKCLNNKSVTFDNVMTICNVFTAWWLNIKNWFQSPPKHLSPNI